MPDAQSFAECMDCACLAARKRAYALTRRYDDHLRGSGLTAHQFSMLSVLLIAGAVPISILAEQLGIDRTTVSRNVALSVERGLVSVSPGRDGRTRLVAITSAGRTAARAALPKWRKAQAEAARMIDG